MKGMSVAFSNGEARGNPYYRKPTMTRDLKDILTNREPVVIELRQRTADIHAQIKGKPGYWGCGRNSYEAIGSLVMAHVEMFGIEIADLRRPQ